MQFALIPFNVLPFHSVVNMTVKHDRAIMLVLIKHDGVVTENDKSSFVIDLSVVLYAFPVKPKPSLHSVMVSLNQVLVAVQALDNSKALFFVLPESIAENVYGVFRRNPPVLALNQVFVHIIRVWKRSVIEADHILMTEMQIRDIVNHVHGPCMLNIKSSQYTCAFS